MFVFRLAQRAFRLSVAVFTVAAVFAVAQPAKADDTAGVARATQAKRTATSFGTTMPSATLTGVTPPRAASGLLYFPGSEPGMNIGGRVNVGKTRLYVPYYGNISTDPMHPGVQGTAGIAYGFRTWDISVLNGGFGTQQATIPGIDPPKANPALSLSVRF